MVIKGDAVKGSQSYLPQITPDPLTADSVWTSAPSTTRTYTFKGLQKTKVYWARLGAAGAKGQLVFSDAVSRAAQ